MPKVINTEVGSSGYSNFVRKFGRVDNIGAEAICWDGGNGYSGWLDAEEDIEVFSSSDLDKAGGIGVQYLQFTGQGNDGIEKTYSVMLNGITPVLLSTTDLGVKFQTIYTAQVFNIEGTNKSPLASENAANQGTITIRSATTLAVMALILPNLGRTQMLIWRCPKDHYAESMKVSIYPIGGKAIVAKLMARDTAVGSWICVGQIDVVNDIASIVNPFPDYISPGTDLCLVIVPGGVGTTCSSQMWFNKKPIRNYEAS